MIIMCYNSYLFSMYFRPQKDKDKKRYILFLVV